MGRVPSPITAASLFSRTRRLSYYCQGVTKQYSRMTVVSWAGKEIKLKLVEEFPGKERNIF